MAPKEDMLPPGWEDLDRYVDRLFRSHAPYPRRCPPPSSASGVLPHLHACIAVEPQWSFGDLDYFLFGKPHT
jgi:hypothetical protein